MDNFPQVANINGDKLLINKAGHLEMDTAARESGSNDLICTVGEDRAIYINNSIDDNLKCHYLLRSIIEVVDTEQLTGKDLPKHHKEFLAKIILPFFDPHGKDSQHIPKHLDGLGVEHDVIVDEPGNVRQFKAACCCERHPLLNGNDRINIAEGENLHGYIDQVNNVIRVSKTNAKRNLLFMVLNVIDNDLFGDKYNKDELYIVAKGLEKFIDFSKGDAIK